MTTSQQRFRIGVLLLGMALLPVISLSQSESKDLGIVRVRYVTIVVPDYDEALNWYTNVLGLEKVEDGTFAPGATRDTFGSSAGRKGSSEQEGEALACRGPRGTTGCWHHSGDGQTLLCQRFHSQLQGSYWQGNEVGVRSRRLPQVL